MRNPAGWMRPRARGRRSSTGSLRRRPSSPAAERGGLRSVGRREGLDLDRAPSVDRDIPLRHVPRAEALTRNGGAANPVDLLQAVGTLYQVVGVLRQEAGDAILDQLGGGTAAQRQDRRPGDHALDHRQPERLGPLQGKDPGGGVGSSTALWTMPASLMSGALAAWLRLMAHSRARSATSL